MRSRYGAYVELAIDYLGETLHPEHRADWDRDATEALVRGAEWLGLQIVSTEGRAARRRRGPGRIHRRFRDQGRVQRHHERSRFQSLDGRWYYVDGELPAGDKAPRAPKVGRNDPVALRAAKFRSAAVPDRPRLPNPVSRTAYRFSRCCSPPLRCRHLLEIGSGTNRHAVYFAADLPHLVWCDRAKIIPASWPGSQRRRCRMSSHRSTSTC